MKQDKICLIVSGGSVSETVLRNALSEKYDLTIAADAGLDKLLRVGMVPDVICGDFDSAKRRPEDIFFKEDKSSVEEPETTTVESKKPQIIRFKPEKDSTDTQIAVEIAIERGCSLIRLLGATGTRLDHFLGNLAVMAKALERGVRVIIEDEHNRIRLIDKEAGFRKEEMRGHYISFIPYGGRACRVSLTGFKYEIAQRDISCFESLGVSNEAAADEMRVMIDNGMLLMIESED